MAETGFICTLRYCQSSYRLCPGFHYNYYDEPSDDLVAIVINNRTKYISRQGFVVYYEQQLAHINEQIEDFQHPEDIEPPAKRRRLH